MVINWEEMIQLHVKAKNLQGIKMEKKHLKGHRKRRSLVNILLVKIHLLSIENKDTPLPTDTAIFDGTEKYLTVQ